VSLLHLIIVAIVQGITEFLPISSSGHLVLVPLLTGWPDQGLVIDVAVHVGTLGAVLIYFWRDTKGLSLAVLASLGLGAANRALKGTDYKAMLWILVLATIPVVIFGAVFAVTGLAGSLRTASIIGATSVIFGVALYWADHRFTANKTLDQITIRDGLMIGLAQVLALIPGTSRSGITMTMARRLGFARPDAARFSMLLAIPTILAAGLLAGIKLVAEGADGQWQDALIGAGLSFFTALAAIHFLMRWLARANMNIFVYYRVVLGLGLVAWVAL
jgi:undecaprenyl-diphosphatase